MFNLTAAMLGLCVLAPFLSLIWVLIRLDSPGPCLFRQPRIGGGGRRFVCYKFRTMTLETIPEPVAIEDFDTFIFSRPRSKPDPRVTRLGAVLRQTSVDELPQLLNVVRGQMALIGPRPELPEIVQQYPPAYHGRHAVLPGVSGLAQISGRSNLTYAEIASCDLEYVNRRSARLDLALLWRTVAAVARGEGAR